MASDFCGRVRSRPNRQEADQAAMPWPSLQAWVCLQLGQTRSPDHWERNSLRHIRHFRTLATCGRSLSGFLTVSLRFLAIGSLPRPVLFKISEFVCFIEGSRPCHQSIILDRKITRLNSSYVAISFVVFFLKN